METAEIMWYIGVGLVVIWSIKFALIAIIATVLFLMVLGISLMIEIILNEMVSAWRDFRRPILEKVDRNKWPRWEVVATLEAASNEILHPVTDCDSVVPVGDPLEPHTSSVYVVGVKKHAVFWLTFTIWRVSMLTGRREYVSHYNFIDFWIGIPFVQEATFKVSAFCSKGVVFVHVRDERETLAQLWRTCTSLLVYDTPYKKWAEFHLCPLEMRYHWPNVILCLARNIEQGKLDWWQIRLVTTADTSNHWRRIIVHSKIQLPTSDSKPPSILSQEELILPASVGYVFLRSCAHHFGLCQEYENGLRQVYLFDAKTDRFEMFPSLELFLSSDAALYDYGRNRFPNIDWYLKDCNPMVLNGREAVQIVGRRNSNDVVITLTRLTVPTLRMTLARSLFEAVPDLATMTADQFRQLSGVDLRGQGHLE